VLGDERGRPVVMIVSDQNFPAVLFSLSGHHENRGRHVERPGFRLPGSHQGRVADPQSFHPYPDPAF
jgi:hypothetical protein